MSKPKICIVGPGRLGSALALALHAAGYAIAEIVSRDRSESRRRARALAKRVSARAVTLANAPLSCELIWICVPDREIASAAASLAAVRQDWRGTTVFHASGALTSDLLAPLAEAGACVASVHPMMTFVRAAAPSLAGVSFAVEGDAQAARVARDMVRRLNGTLIKIAKEDKRLYHAWGAFASPLLICQLATADRIAAELGLSAAQARATLAPIFRQTIENYIAHGPAEAFSGPLVRGDAATVRAHLDELSRVAGAQQVYLALADAGIRSLPVENRQQIEQALAQAKTQKKVVQPASRNIGGIIQPY